MISIPIEELLAKKNCGRYKITVLAFERAWEILTGAKPLVEVENKKVSNVVLNELLEEKVKEADHGAKKKKK